MINSKTIMPALLSLVLVSVAQAVRANFDYPIYPNLFIVPLLVYLFLTVVAALAFSDDSGLPREDFRQGYKIALWGLAFLFVYGGIGLVLVIVVWGSGYLTPIFEAQYSAGFAHIDTLYHAAISNMLIYFGVLSTGVEGVVSIDYHYASHLAIGLGGRLLGFGAWEAYHLVYPTLILPVWIGLLVILTESVRSVLALPISRYGTELAALALFLVTRVGVLPKSLLESFNITNNSLFSESHAFAITLLYLFAIVAIRFYNLNNARLAFVLCAAVALIGASFLTLSKVAVGVLWVAALGFIWFEKPKELSRLWISCSAMAGWLLVIVPRFFSINSLTNQGLQLFHYMDTYLEQLNWAWYPLLYYSLTIMAVILLDYMTLRKQVDLNRARTVKFVIIGVALVGALPGLLVPIGGASADYFSNVNWWVSLPVLAVLIAALWPQVRLWWGSIAPLRSFRVIIIALGVTCLLTMGLNAQYLYDDFIIRNWRYAHQRSEHDYELFKALTVYSQDSLNPRAIEYEIVPQYGHRGPYKERTWLIAFLSSSALTGLPTLNETGPYLSALQDRLETDRFHYGFDIFLMDSYVREDIDFHVITIPRSDLPGGQ